MQFNEKETDILAPIALLAVGEEEEERNYYRQFLFFQFIIPANFTR